MVQLVIGGLSAGTQVAKIAGWSAAYLAYNASLQQATLHAQALAVTAIIAEGALLMAYTNESSIVKVQIVDKGGST